VIVLPVVLLYQGWTYYVFRHRVGAEELAATPTTEAPAAPPGVEPV
jgi:hypothetical protein